MTRLAGVFRYIALPILLLAAGCYGAAAAPLRAFIGTWTPDPFHHDSPEANHGEGIYTVEVDQETGALSKPRLTAKTPSPTWMTLDHSGHFLYVTNDVSRFNGVASGSVSAFSVNRATGTLTPLGSVSAHGLSPCFISLDPFGHYLLVADYLGGVFLVLPILRNGALGEAVDIQRPTGPRSPDRAADDPPGNFAISDHSMSRAHMIMADPSEKFILTDDAGLDQIQVWKLDPATGHLSAGDAHTFAMPPGSAPRHFAFDPGGRILYQAFEQDSMLASYSFDPATGAIKFYQKVSTLPPGFAGSNLVSELLISHDGRNLYVANRTFDTIAVFSAGVDGALKAVGQEPTRGDTPRSLAISPSGAFLYSLNQKADSVTSYRINSKTGALRFTGHFLPLGSPASMVFLK